MIFMRVLGNVGDILGGGGGGGGGSTPIAAEGGPKKSSMVAVRNFRVWITMRPNGRELVDLLTEIHNSFR